MSIIFDNIGDRKFLTGLRAILTAAGVKRADFCAGYFNLRGWKAVAGEVGQLPGCGVRENRRTPAGGDHWETVQRKCRLLVGMHRPAPDLVSELYDVVRPQVDLETAQRWRRAVATDFRRQLALGAPTAEDETGLKALRAQLADGTVAVKLHLRFPLHAKLYLAHRPGDPAPALAVMGSSNLTFGGLAGNGELDAQFADAGDTQVYSDWFDARWNDLFSIDVTQDLLEVLDASWASVKGLAPYDVYLKTMYHLSREARTGASEYRLPPPFDRQLLDFQRTAVQLTVRHLETRGGAMLGDVVGLGKTITACAVAKWYETSLGASTLVLCPANLVPMWQAYKARYDLKIEVKSLAARIDPQTEPYRPLVVVDESQNLRNAEGTRYARIRDFLAFQRNKVLLLTATPYNKDYRDLKNQLRLIPGLAEADLGIRPERHIERLGGEHAFAVAHPDVPPTSLEAFAYSEEADDWRDLMKLFLVRRTRTFIKRHYARRDKRGHYLELPDGTKNYFPERRPETVRFPTHPDDAFSRMHSDGMVALLDALSLPRYGLKNYIDPSAAATAGDGEARILANLSRAGRRLIGFRLSNFYKRMDSSGLAFLVSLHRHAVRDAMYLWAIRNGRPLPIRAEVEIDGGPDGDDDDGNGDGTAFRFSRDPAAYMEEGRLAYARAGNDGGIDWIDPRYFRRTLARDLKADLVAVCKMLDACGDWDPSEDEKLSCLCNLLEKTHRGEKVLVFTQYSDTARYLAAQLRARGIGPVDEVDGDTEDPTAAAARFSPVSNDARARVPADRETRVLVATDMLSEGQNLQDCHVVVNYDLPWAIIRLIQRAGRVDRIGQRASVVHCHSFFPDEGIERIIRLRARLNRRINQNAEVLGSDEIFFEGNECNLRELYNETKGVLDGEEGEVDLASQAYQIWEAAIRGRPDLARRIEALEDVVYSSKAAAPGSGRGVVTYARTRNGSDALVWLDESGNVVTTSPVRIFEAVACTEKTAAVPPLPNHHDLVRSALRRIEETGGMGVGGGVLGSRGSVKYRVFAMLENRIREEPGSLFGKAYRKAADELFNRPLRETARNLLGKMLRQNRPADEILHTVLDLSQDGQLCLEPEEGARRAARIICSMGLA